MRTFVFAIGGTGARVLRSLTMLLAAGVKGTSTKNEIIPIIIDYDVDNGDTNRTQDILECYQRIHRDAYKVEDEVEGRFFCTPVRKLKEIVKTTEEFNPNSKFEVYLGQENTNITFADHIRMSSLGGALQPTNDLLKALYDNSPEDSKTAELNLNLEKGFKGCPNIGCVVTRALENSLEIQQFLNNVTPFDRIFIIGSIFGGTGASGIPMLLDLIREKEDLNTVPVGILAVSPYFKVSRDVKSAIDSDTFCAKTKAALDAYDLGKSVNTLADAVYYVGDEKVEESFPNHEGSMEQKNEAHLVEMVGAMCVIHFMNEDKNEFHMGEQDAAFYELGMTSTDSPIGYLSFKNETRYQFIDPMVRFVMFNKFCRDYMLVKGEGEKNDTWLRNTGLSADNKGKKELDTFIGYFNDWIKELGGTKRPVTLFRPESQYIDLYYDIKTAEKGFFGKPSALVSSESIRKELAEQWKKETDNGKKTPYNGRPWFFFFQSADRVMNETVSGLFKNKENSHLTTTD